MSTITLLSVQLLFHPSVPVSKDMLSIPPGSEAVGNPLASTSGREASTGGTHRGTTSTTSESSSGEPTTGGSSRSRVEVVATGSGGDGRSERGGSGRSGSSHVRRNVSGSRGVETGSGSTSVNRHVACEGRSNENCQQGSLNADENGGDSVWTSATYRASFRGRQRRSGDRC